MRSPPLPDLDLSVLEVNVCKRQSPRLRSKSTEDLRRSERTKEKRPRRRSIPEFLPSSYERNAIPVPQLSDVVNNSLPVYRSKSKLQNWSVSRKVRRRRSTILSAAAIMSTTNDGRPQKWECQVVPGPYLSSADFSENLKPCLTRRSFHWLHQCTDARTAIDCRSGSSLDLCPRKRVHFPDSSAETIAMVPTHSQKPAQVKIITPIARERATVSDDDGRR